MSSSAPNAARISIRPAPIASPPRPALTRPRECAVSGTAAGLARHLGSRAWPIRMLFIVLTPMGGAGMLLYAWCWALTPWEAAETKPSRRVPVAWMLLVPAIIMLLITLPQLGYAAGYPAGETSLGGPILIFVTAVLLSPIVLAVAAALWAEQIDRADPARGPRHAAIVRGLAVVVLLVLVFAALTRPVQPAFLLAPFAGLLIMFSSSLMRRLQELAGERIRRIREEQRSEMAAHLHDSVLQTLALIQNRAGASSEAARLARAQERELRAWLYDGDAPADSDLATDLRDYGGALELDYAVRIDVVSAGLSTERASGELAAAAREAMLNAARHAGGEISVYIEGAASAVDVYIRDRGAGFRLDDVPGDRLGVRQSIIGRMRRVGGSATVRSDESGTEVHLSIVGATGRAEE